MCTHENFLLLKNLIRKVGVRLIHRCVLYGGNTVVPNCVLETAWKWENVVEKGIVKKPVIGFVVRFRHSVGTGVCNDLQASVGIVLGNAMLFVALVFWSVYVLPYNNEI